MKKLMFVFALMIVALGFSFSSTPVQAAYVEMKSFLLEHYGWTIDLPLQEKSFFSFSDFAWDIACDSDRPPLPKEGKTYGWVCRQKDKVFWTTILWLVPGTDPAPFEKDIFESMAGDQYRTYKVACTTTEEGPGTYKDCSMKLNNGTFFVSFYYFETKLPTGGTLDFALYVKNASPQGSNPAVKDKLRELVSAIRPALSTIHAASQ